MMKSHPTSWKSSYYMSFTEKYNLLHAPTSVMFGHSSLVLCPESMVFNIFPLDWLYLIEIGKDITSKFLVLY